MDYDPFAVIEGMTLAGYATGATRGILYLRYEYPETNLKLEKAIADAYAANLLGKNILGSNFNFELYVRRWRPDSATSCSPASRGWLWRESRIPTGVDWPVLLNRCHGGAG